MLWRIKKSSLRISVELISGDLGFVVSLPGERKSFLLGHVKILGDQIGLVCLVSVNFRVLLCMLLI